MSFVLDLSKFGTAAIVKADLILKKVTMDVFDRVIMKTPFDKGRARANWQASIGKMETGILNEKDSGSATSSKAQSVVASAGISSVVYLANNLPYIRKLEHGHSDQAPQGMVKTTLSEFQGIVKEKS